MNDVGCGDVDSADRQIEAVGCYICVSVTKDDYNYDDDYDVSK